MSANMLAHQLEISSHVLDLNTKDLSQEESLARPERGGNCLNWVLGHLTRTRNMALASMGQKPPFPVEDFAAYDDRGGVPFSRETALPIEELRRRFKATQEPLVRAIKGMSPEVLAGRPPRNLTGDPNETVESQLATFTFHESYHVGQTGVLRRVAGKPGVIKPPEQTATRYGGDG
jgi:uncharacterized damage-inducible protein DinB